MAKRFDATTKHLIEAYPADWLALAHLPVGRPADVRVVDADLSAFTVAADKVLRVDGPEPYIAHFELQASADPDLDARTLVYNVLLRSRHRVRVCSVVVLLRPQAQAGVTGGVREAANADTSLDFRYQVVRVWEQDPAAVIAGGLGTLPLAAISAVEPGQVSDVLRQVEQRLTTEAQPALARELMTASVILMGLRYPREMVDKVLRGVRQMKESVTYQIILEEGMERGLEKGRTEGRAEGRTEGERAALLRLGTRRLGPPDPATLSRLQDITDAARLDALLDRVLTAGSWDELLEAGK